jgi:hypothetical protein
MVALNRDLREAKEVSIAYIFIQKSYPIMRSVKDGQLSLEQARTQLQAFPAPTANPPASSTTAYNKSRIGNKHLTYHVSPPEIRATTSEQTLGQSQPLGSLLPTLRTLSILNPLSPLQLSDEPQGLGADEEEREEEWEREVFQKIKGEDIEQKLTLRGPGPNASKYLDDQGEVKESIAPDIKGPSLVPCERCVSLGFNCLAFNTTRRSVCSNCYKRKKKCSNFKKATREPRNGGARARSKSRPRATPKPRRVLSTRVDELEQVIDGPHAEVSQRDRNEKMENALLTIANFVQKHTELVEAQAKAERGTARRLQMLEAALPAAGIPIPRADDGLLANTQLSSGPLPSGSHTLVNDVPPDPVSTLATPYVAQAGRKRTVSDVSAESPSTNARAKTLRVLELS